MKKFTAQVYDKDKRKYRDADVYWIYSSMNRQVDIKSVEVAGVDIKDSIEPSHLQAIREEAEKLSRYLTHEERVEMMNEISNEYRK